MRHKRLAPQSDPLAEQGGVNLTPLIDVVFVVLILFILVAPMVEIDRVKLASAPNRESPETTNPKTLLIHVYEDNTVSINKRPIAHENLSPILKALYAKNPALCPQLFQDRKALFGTYQTVKNAVEEAGYSELEVVLESKR